MYNEFNNANEPNVIIRPDTFALIAIIAGVVAIPASMFIIPGIIIGIAAITLGVISRINSEKFCIQNTLAIVFGVIALFLSATMFLGMLTLLKDPQIMAEFSKIAEMYYQ